MKGGVYRMLTLLRHFDQFQDEINELYESKFEKPF